jgi:pilus assembly protein Flp/PilA
MGSLVFKRFGRDERGASLVEYSILIGLIAAATIALIGSVGGKVTASWTGLNTAWVQQAASGGNNGNCYTIDGVEQCGHTTENGSNTAR